MAAFSSGHGRPPAVAVACVRCASPPVGSEHPEAIGVGDRWRRDRDELNGRQTDATGSGKMMESTPKYVVIVANPLSGTQDRRRELERLRDAIGATGLGAEIIESLGEARRAIDRAAGSGRLRAVVAAGGDGTVCAVANMTPADIPLLVFPMGTENLLAKFLGVSRDVESVCTALHSGREYRMDAGRADGRLFLVVATCGYDAEVVRQMERVRRGHIRRWSYAGPILRSMWRYRFPSIAIRADGDGRGEALQWSAAWVFVFNSPRYAAGLKICPQADPTDGWLDLCTFQRGGVLWGFWYLFRLCLGIHQRSRGFRHVRCRRIELSLSTPDCRGGTPPCFQIDGDIGGALPARIEILRERIRFLLPPGDSEKGD